MKESTRVLAALIAALALGITVAQLNIEPALRAFDSIAWIGTIWVNAIRMTVIPLVVALLITGIASANDLTTIGRLGGRTLLVFFLLLAGTAAVAMPAARAAFGMLSGFERPALPPGATESAQALASDQVQTFSGWLTSLVPTNPIAAAASGAMLPLIVFTILLALALTRSAPASRASLVAFFQAIADTMLVLVRWVILFAPVGVFALVLPVAARSGGSLVGAIGFYVAMYSLFCIAFVLLLYPVVAVFGGIPIAKFARAALPAQMIAFSSSSSMASLPALVESAERGLGIPNRVAGFVLPLAVSIFKLAAPVSWTVGALFVAWFYHVPLGIPEIAIIAFTAVFLAVAGPGVPRGAFIILAPLFVQIGLPVEGLGILIAVDAIPDIFATVMNVTGDLAACAIVARKEEKTS